MSDYFDHTAEAAMWLRNFEQKDPLRAAQVHATLAVAEQQRIGNLIALARLEAEGGGTDRVTFDAVFGPGHSPEAFGYALTVRPDIRQGLGL